MSALTKVYLEGEMGRRFGGEWNLRCRSPGHALRLVNANRPGLFAWIRSRLTKFPNYRVVAERHDGAIEEYDNDTVQLNCSVKTLWFIPTIEGASSAGVKMVAGAALMVVGAAINYFSGGTLAWLGTPMMAAGFTMFVGGAVEYLTKQKNEETEKKNSYGFDGAGNTTVQGNPVALIYGKNVVVPGQAVSLDYTVVQTNGLATYDDDK